MNWLNLFQRILLNDPTIKVAPEPVTQADKEKALEDRILEFMECTGWNDLVTPSCETVHPIITRVIENMPQEGEFLEDLFPDMPKLQKQIATCTAIEMAEQLKASNNGHLSQKQEATIITQVGFSVMLAFQVERVWKGETHDIP